jgi:hypothetical protein
MRAFFARERIRTAVQRYFHSGLARGSAGCFLFLQGAQLRGFAVFSLFLQRALPWTVSSFRVSLEGCTPRVGTCYFPVFSGCGAAAPSCGEERRAAARSWFSLLIPLFLRGPIRFVVVNADRRPGGLATGRGTHGQGAQEA